MLVNGAEQSFQRKIHLQPFLRLIMRSFVALSFFPREQDQKPDPDPNLVALSF